MKKYLLLLCIPFLFILASCDDDTYTIDQVTIDAQINPDGTMKVRELFTYTFSGEFNGMTRSIKSDEKDFTAYLANGITDPTNTTDNLTDLKTEYDDDDNEYKIYTASKNETKTVLYNYVVEGSVKKYRDVGTLLYTFFDEDNETDLHDVSITIHPPSHTMDGTHAYLHDKHLDKLTTNRNGAHYETELLKKGNSAPVRLIFPADELDSQNVTKSTTMKPKLIDEEEALKSRYEHRDENMARVKPFIWLLFTVLLLACIFYFTKHPASKIKKKDTSEVQQVLEKMDPLFAKFLFDNDVNFGRNVTNESIIAALFSLRRRGIVTIQKVPSQINEGEETFCFTWVHDDKEIDMADSYLKQWLFTEEGKYGEYFLLESIVEQKGESDNLKKSKAEKFEAGMDTWSGFIKSKEKYQDLKKVFRPYRLLSIPFTMIMFGLFYYFTQVETISTTLSWLLPSIVGVMAALSFIFNRNKWIISSFHIVVIIFSFIWFTLSFTIILSIILYSFSLILLLLAPSKYWIKEIRELKQVIRQAKKMFKKGEYPVDANTHVNENQLEYAIILDEGKQYAEKCEREYGALSKIGKDYPLLQSPTFSVNTMSTHALIFYTSSSTATSTSSSSSSGGGGGAGAF
ncbi:MAG TPA: DUF2207 domain-containing protein [Bacillota bacterium]|nr:DUF2207 domain-containing protein [Bacillota bacterium]